MVYFRNLRVWKENGTFRRGVRILEVMNFGGENNSCFRVSIKLQSEFVDYVGILIFTYSFLVSLFLFLHRKRGMII